MNLSGIFPAMPERMKSGMCTSMLCSSIYLACFLKAEDKDIKWLMNCGILPPSGMRKRDLALWIDGAKAGYYAAPVVVFEQVIQRQSTSVVVEPAVRTATIAASNLLLPQPA